MACFGGVCTTHFPNCIIEGVSYPPGSKSPVNSCGRCQARQSQKTWTNAPDGSPCGIDAQCSAGQCESLFF